MKLSAEPLPNLPPPAIVHTALSVLRTVQRGATALAPAEVALWDALLGAARTELIGLAARLELADRIAEGALSADELARATQCHGPTLFRAMRAMAAFGLFELREDERFANNRMSRTLMKDAPRSLRDGVLYFTSDSNLRAWRSFEHSVRTGESAFDHAHEQSVWQWFDAHPEELAVFARAMGRATAIEAPQIATIYPFEELSRLCDVGGGSGTLLSEILVRHKSLRGVLCDGPGVFDEARRLLTARGVMSRVELAPGSFFDRVPEGCDCYLLKNILHDWDDERSLKILQIVRASTALGRKVLLCDAVVERVDRRPEATLSDLQMIVACSGKERTIDEFRALLEGAGFRMGRVFRGAINALIEGVAV